MLEMLGYEYDEFMSECRGMLINAVHKEDQLQLTKKLKDSFLHDQPYEVEYRLRKKMDVFCGYIIQVGLRQQIHSRKLF